MAKMLGSKMMSSGQEPDPLGQDLVRPPADLDLPIRSVGLTLLIEGHHHNGRTVAAHSSAWCTKASSPSFRLMELDDAFAL
jgi:hypothetical protein